MDDVDDWFFASIKRYNKLQMYTLDENVNHIEFSPNKSNICVSNQNLVTKRCQILEYALPSKFLDINDSLCSTDHNLKIVSGTYVDQLVLELKVLPSFNQIITSEKHLSSVKVYSLPLDDTDKIKKTSSIEYLTPEPHISTCSDFICLSSSNTIPALVIDVNTKHPVHKIHMDLETIQDTAVRTIFVDSNILCLCMERGGQVRLYDLRCPGEFLSVHCKKDKSHNRWSASLLENSNCLNLISSNAQVRRFDIRNPDKPTFHCELSIKNNLDDTLPQIETCPHDTNIFSVIGFNENVHIFSIREETLCDELFTHDAHAYQEHCDKNTRVLCHKWMPKPYERMLLSSSDNCSVTCVQYNSKLT